MSHCIKQKEICVLKCDICGHEYGPIHRFVTTDQESRESGFMRFTIYGRPNEDYFLCKNCTESYMTPILDKCIYKEN